MKVVYLFSALVFLANPVSAAQVVNMLTMGGLCSELRLGKDDLTPACGSHLMQMVYDDGRAGLYAFAADQIFAFSGTSDQVVDNRIHQVLDKVILGKSADDVMEFPVRGSCVFENPFEGPAEFTCDARGPEGLTFALRFTTDGNAPVDEMAK